MKGKKQPTSRMEDYLETISLLNRKKGTARVKDIGGLIGVKNPSVTGALSILAKNGFITHKPYGKVELTKSGEKIARQVQTRHDTLVKFLTQVLRLHPETADRDACRIEHAISTETFKKLAEFIKKFELNKPEPNIGKNITKKYKYE